MSQALEKHPEIGDVTSSILSGGVEVSGRVTAQVLLVDFDSRDARQADSIRTLLTRHPLPTLALVPEPEHTLLQGVLQRRRPDIARLAEPHGLDPLVATLRALVATGYTRRRQSMDSPSSVVTASGTTASGTTASGTTASGTTASGTTASGTTAVSPAPVLIGASTGGPQALKEVLQALPATWEHPIVIVQHISPGFAEGLASWLASVLQRTVSLAVDGDPVLHGEIRIAPAGLHLRLSAGHYRLDASERRNFQRPSVDFLFESAAACYGRRTIAVLLTGMGKDGAEGCRAVVAQGGRTLVQDQESSVVWGMPGAAVAAEAATEVLPLSRIGPRLSELVPTRDRR